MLGAGWMGKAHTNAYKTASYIHAPDCNWRPRLVAIGDIDEAKGKAAAERYGYEIGVEGYEEIIANPEVTIFDNVTPDYMHVQPTIDAALAGKHVVCEKPLAWDPEDAKRMLNAARSAGVKHMCCFSYRFLPAVRLAYELMQSGALGKIYHFSGRYFQDSGHDENAPAEQAWYSYSGVSQGIGCHLLDMARFLMGEIKMVSGMSNVYNKIRDSKNGPVAISGDEGFFSLLEFDSDATGCIQTLGVATGRRSQFAFEISGSKGSVYWDVEEPNFLHVFLAESVNSKVLGFTKVCATEPNHPFMDTWWPPGHTLGWEHGHINMLTHFMDCVANDKPVSPLAATFEDGYKAAQLISAIKQSSKSGARVFLDDE